MAKQPIPLPIPIEEKKCEECPKCPPVGAPAWMATFADMATLLMAFFVLILAFAEFNSPKFKQIAGSLKNAFGVQRITPVVEQPRGTTVLELKFSPNPEQSTTQKMTQETVRTEAPEIEKNTADEGDGGQEKNSQATNALAQALAEALENGSVQVKSENGEVVMQFSDQGQSAEEKQENLVQQINDAAEALEKASRQTGQGMDDVKMSGLGDQMDTMADMAQAAQQAQAATQALNELTQAVQQAKSQADAEQAVADAQAAADAAEQAKAQRKAELTEAELRVSLRQEIADGLVDVETREDKVFITVGAGGSFPSGTADLTDQAREIMTRIAFSSMSDSSEITVTGHTDDVQIGAGSEFRDNWDLAAARSASVVREMVDTGMMDPTKVKAVSMGESAPIADNSTAEGREKNRRIEIEITY